MVIDEGGERVRIGHEMFIAKVNMKQATQEYEKIF